MPKDRLIKDFLGKKVELEDFKEEFKKLSMNYHYYNLVKEKLSSIN